jgi:diguanylate cyclase (GGDEF)-like protein
MARPWRSLRAAVLAAIVAGVVLPAALVVWIDQIVARRTQQPVIERTRAAVVALSATAITEPAWTLSEPGLVAAIDHILREPSVCAVEVLGLQPAAVSADLRRSNCTPGAPTVPLETEVRHEGQTIARLRLHFDDRELDRLLAERRTGTLWVVAAQVLAGVTVIAGLLSLRLLRPIDALKRQADGLADRHAEPPPAWSSDDELGDLGRHLSAVHAQLRSLIDELEQKNHELRRVAMHDALTGLPNRTLLRELFTLTSAQTRRDGHPMALLFVDLDHFKTINDSHGHAAGDALLQSIGHRLRSVVREADVVCRMGGDEFLVLLPGAGDAEAAGTAVRIINALALPMPLPGVAAAVRMGTSVGIARFPEDGEDFDALVHAADVAMYRSKQLGRGRHSAYHVDMDAALRARHALQRELDEALAHGQLRLHYQPVVDPDDGRITGAEALLRWQHPQRGLLAPDAFIAVAEESGQIRKLGRWVLDTACDQLAAWLAAGHAGLRLSINVSALQLREAGFPDEVAAAVVSRSLPRQALELELTESTLLAEGDAAERAVSALRGAGVRLAVDDFGTGYSSLAALKLLRPDRLKIDRGFVRDLPERAEDGALIQAMFGMAHALGIEVVVEGVETTAQRDWLQRCGQHLQQGWLWARALPPEEFERRLPALGRSA